MVDVWKSARLGRFDATRGSDTTFVAMIARRRLIDRNRRRSASTPLPLVESGAAPASQPADAEDVVAATAALRELSEAQQTAIRLAIVQGLTHEQVAEATGMPLGTVKAHIRRGLIRLREVLVSKSFLTKEVAP